MSKARTLFGSVTRDIRPLYTQKKWVCLPLWHSNANEMAAD